MIKLKKLHKLVSCPETDSRRCSVRKLLYKIYIRSETLLDKGFHRTPLQVLPFQFYISLHLLYRKLGNACIFVLYCWFKTFLQYIFAYGLKKKNRIRKQPPEVFYIKKVFSRFSQNSHGKHLCQSLFFNKVADFSWQLY